MGEQLLGKGVTRERTEERNGGMSKYITYGGKNTSHLSTLNLNTNTQVVEGEKRTPKKGSTDTSLNMGRTFLLHLYAKGHETMSIDVITIILHLKGDQNTEISVVQGWENNNYQKANFKTPKMC